MQTDKIFVCYVGTQLSHFRLLISLRC